MSAAVSPRRSNPFVTSRLNGARKEFLAALTEAITTTDIFRDQAEGLLSGLLCDMWNEGELLAQRLPRALTPRATWSPRDATSAVRTQTNAALTLSDPPVAVAEPAAVSPAQTKSVSPPSTEQPSKPEELAVYVYRVINQKRLSLSLVEARASRDGHKISGETVRSVLNGSANNLTIARLHALAAGLGEPFEKVLFCAAGIQAKEPSSE